MSLIIDKLRKENKNPLKTQIASSAFFGSAVKVLWLFSVLWSLVKVLQRSRVCDQSSSALFSSAVKVLRLSQFCGQGSSALMGIIKFFGSFGFAIKVFQFFSATTKGFICKLRSEKY
ncbi:hypothetical protein RhiirC2_719839 [Rhizophagus irregularis]|uniref:Uncharacterized protein n=1 Tax=Rhizophagus irregularis TaxID=588596 RepID=A0A2N1MCP3_9GLOM|nr:hypothetical protein RhiirC2_719839 [Rhizophagus irregularis]